MISKTSNCCSVVPLSFPFPLVKFFFFFPSLSSSSPWHTPFSLENCQSICHQPVFPSRTFDPFLCFFSFIVSSFFNTGKLSSDRLSILFCMSIWLKSNKTAIVFSYGLVFFSNTDSIACRPLVPAWSARQFPPPFRSPLSIPLLLFIHLLRSHHLSRHYGRLSCVSSTAHHTSTANLCNAHKRWVLCYTHKRTKGKLVVKQFTRIFFRHLKLYFWLGLKENPNKTQIINNSTYKNLSKTKKREKTFNSFRKADKRHK